MKRVLILIMVLILVGCTKEYTIESVDNLEIENLTNNGQIIQEEKSETIEGCSREYFTRALDDFFEDVFSEERMIEPTQLWYDNENGVIYELDLDGLKIRPMAIEDLIDGWCG